MIEKREYANGTYVTNRKWSGAYVSAHVLCSDGKIRATSRLGEAADTFFSVPAAVKVNGKTVSGFIMIDDTDGVSFSANRDGRNCGLLHRSK